MCSIAILSLQLTTISFSRTYSSLRNGRLCGKWTSPLVNVLLCPSPLSVCPSSFSYALCNTPSFPPPPGGVTFQKYLGANITNSLNWTKQAVGVKKKANKVLGVLQRNLSSCSAVVKERQQQVYFKLNIAYKACTCPQLTKAIRGGYKRKRKIV